MARSTTLPIPTRPTPTACKSIADSAPMGGAQNLKDHLGNARLTFTDKNGNGVVDQTNLGSTKNGNLDKTDAIAVLGVDGKQVTEFVKSHLSSIASASYFDGFGGSDNPERSEGESNVGTDNNANVIALSALGIIASTPSKYWDEKGVTKGDQKDPFHETAATMLLHGATHLGGVNSEHKNGRGFSESGQDLLTILLAGRGYESGKYYETEGRRTDIKHYRDFFKKGLDDHKVNIEFLKTHFGKHEPVQRM